MTTQRLKRTLKMPISRKDLVLEPVPVLLAKKKKKKEKRKKAVLDKEIDVHMPGISTRNCLV